MLFYTLDTLGIFFPSRTIGLDDQWMGFLRGRPYLALWPYDRIARVRFESLQVGQDKFRLMIASPRAGREVAFGLSNQVDVHQIIDFLTNKGVEVMPV